MTHVKHLFLFAALQTAVNGYSVTLVARLQVFFASTKVLSLILIIALGIIQVSSGKSNTDTYCISDFIVFVNSRLVTFTIIIRVAFHQVMDNWSSAKQ